MKIVRATMLIAIISLLSYDYMSASYGMITPRFELRNHDLNPIAITLWQLGEMKPEYVLINNQELAGKKGSVIASHTNYDIDPTVPGYILQITYSDKGKPRRAVYRLAPSSKFYLAWDPSTKSNPLRPQKGSGIFSKTTQSGFSLENNITQKGITKIQ